MNSSYEIKTLANNEFPASSQHIWLISTFFKIKPGDFDKEGYARHFLAGFFFLFFNFYLCIHAVSMGLSL